jgi:hypothetical protein
MDLVSLYILIKTIQEYALDVEGSEKGWVYIKLNKDLENLDYIQIQTRITLSDTLGHCNQVPIMYT